MAHEAPNHSPVPDGVPDGASAYDQRVVASRPALDVVSPQYTEAANAAAGNGNGGSGLSPQDGQQTPASGKSTRHRNKPSLSCSTCTSKKTKVRGLLIYPLAFFLVVLRPSFRILSLDL